MSVKVKICGIRTLEAAQVAVDAGADYLGFNFVPSSKRFIKPTLGEKIITKVKGKIPIVGIFQNADLSVVKQLIKQLDLDFVQLHGQENQAYINQIDSPVIKVIHSFAQTHLYSVEYFLLDRIEQGEGEMVDTDIAKAVANQYPIFLAGGLTPQNIANVVKEVKPFAVDVAGGIETEGAEDIHKISMFLQNAKGEKIV